MNHTVENLLALAGTVTGAALITTTLPDLLENLGVLTIFGYTVGVFIITCKLNSALLQEMQQALLW